MSYTRRRRGGERWLGGVMACSVIAFICLVSSPSYSMEFVVPKDFEASGTLQTIRIHAMSGATSIRISLPGSQVVTDYSDTLATAGEYKDWSIPAGSRIVTDKPVLAVKYATGSSPWNEKLVGSGQSVSISGAQYAIAAAQEAGQISIDFGNGAEQFDVAAGAAIVFGVGEGKVVAATKNVSVFGYDGNVEEIYVIAPDAVNQEFGSSYEKLYPVGGTPELSAAAPQEDSNATP